MDDIDKLYPPFIIRNYVVIEDMNGHVCTTDSLGMSRLIVEALVEKYAKVVTERVDP